MYFIKPVTALLLFKFQRKENINYQS